MALINLQIAWQNFENGFRFRFIAINEDNSELLSKNNPTRAHSCRLLEQYALKATMIELGLARIIRLLQDTPITWRAIHIAGTNGKGSVCAYASAMLNAGKYRCGRYTSPHLIDRWDCITIDEKTVNEKLFHEVEAIVKARDQKQGIKASEFEILTATAFEIFNREKIEVGIVEVGLGGRHDATNALQFPTVTVITKIGKDHQSFLGNTLEEIAYQKAGIMKKAVPCIVDGSNMPSVLEVLRHNAEEVQASSMRVIPQDSEDNDQVWVILPKEEFEVHQQMNICLAFQAIKEVLAYDHLSLNPRDLLLAISQTVWPGRLQTLSIKGIIGTEQNILLDGAHNAQSAEVLGSYVDRKLRKKHGPVTWVIAMSKGKDVQELLACLLKLNDNFIAVKFGPVDGMPWVRPEERETLVAAAQGLDVEGLSTHTEEKLDLGLRWAAKLENGGPLVVAGSLYLVSDVLRMLRDKR